jgi:hypothetical protein
MDDARPGWKVWARDPTPADLMQVAKESPKEVQDDLGPQLKPCINDEMNEDRERVVESLRRLKAQHATEEVKSHELKNHESKAQCTIPEGLTITLR